MNKHAYRIIFNKVRGIRMVVAENVSAQCGAGGPGAADRDSGDVPAWMAMRRISVAVALLFGPAAVTFAQIVADPGAAQARRPLVESTANGRPLVRIATPSAAGVSHNQYSQYNVDANGAVLNNAARITQSQQGGFIDGNPNLAAGGARIILNEVTGASGSQLRGYTEVAGQRAEVIIANPNGISCNGCGFINASRGVLTTGTPVFGADGSLEAFRVVRGHLQIGADGLNGNNMDQLDLIARSVEVNGALWGKQLSVITGANQAAYADLGVQVIEGVGAQPTVGIDIAQLGGMYGNKIRLIGTEAGVGVNSRGAIAAQAGDLVVDSKGKLTFSGSTTASGRMTLNGDGGIDNSGSLYGAQALTLDSKDRISNSGSAASQGTLTVTGGSIDSSGTLAAGADQDGRLGRSGSLTVSAAGSLTATGHNIAADTATLEGAALDLSGATTEAGTALVLTARSGDMKLGGARTAADGSISIRAAAGTVYNDAVAPDAAIRIEAAEINITAAGLSNRGGVISQTGDKDSAITLTGKLDNSGGSMGSKGRNLAITSGALVNDDGSMAHAGAGLLTIHAASLSNQRGLVSGNGATVITASSMDNRHGGITAVGAGSLNVAGSADNSDGLLGAGGVMGVNAASFDNTRGRVMALGGGGLTFTVTGALTNRAGVAADGSTLGLIGSNGDNTITAGTLRNSGIISAIQTLNVGAGAWLDNSDGKLLADGLLTATAGAAWTNTGGTARGRQISMSASGLLNQRGLISQSGAGDTTINARAGLLDNSNGTMESNGDKLTVTSGTLSNDGGAIIHAGYGSLHVETGDLSNLKGGDGAGGAIHSNGDAVLTAAAASNSGTITALRTLELSTTSLHNDGGAIASNSALTVKAGSLLTNDGGSLRAGAGASPASATVSAAALDNSGGAISAGSVDIDATTLSNRGGLIVQGNGGGKAQFTVRQTLDNRDGDIGVAAADLTLAPGAALLNQGGTITHTGSGKLVLGGASLINDAGVLGTNGQATITVGSLSNRGGTLSAVGALDIVSASNVDNAAEGAAAGYIGGASVTVTAASGLVDNRGGAIEGAGNGVTVTAQTVNNTAGSIRNLGDKALTVTATGALVNRDGVLGGKGNVDVTGAGIDNRGGTIGAEGKVTVVSGAEIRNGAGAIQAVGDVSVTAVGELQNALGKIRAVGAASQLSASAASVDNAGGRIVNAGAGPTVISAGSEVVNANADAVPDGGVIGGNGDVTVNAPTLRNVQGAQLQAGGVLALNTPAMVDNSGGKLTAGGVLSMKQGGAALINRDGEISGGQVDIGSASLDNTRGLIANPYGSGGAISIDTGLLTNAAGRIGSDHDLVIDATTLAGRGRIIGGRDAHVSLQGNYTNEADNLITANRDLTLSTTGVLTNAGTLAAAGNITLNAAGIANQSGALIASGSPDDLSAGQTTLNATNGDIDNAGRMEGNTVDSFSRSFSNRATVIGNVVTISADSITNDGPAAVIAGVDQVNLWAQGVLNNQNGGALFSLGDLNIAADGVIDDKGYLLHRTGVINNLSSTVEAGGALNVAADQVNNVRQDVRTETVLVGDQTATLTPLPWWTPRAPGVGTPERNSNTVRIDAYYLDPGAVISDTPVITPDGYVVHKAVVRLNANESAFQWMEGGLSYSLPDNGVDAQYGSQSRIAPQAGTQVMYYVGRLDQQSNPDQVKGQSAWSQFDKHQIRTSLGSIAYSSDYGNCATNCVRLDTLPGYKDPSLDLDMLTKRVRAGGTEAGVYPVEVQRTAHQTVTETRLLDSSGAPATITSGDAMRFNVGVRLNNDNGQIAAGGALLVNGTQTADGSDVQTISNTGTQLTRTYTFANRSGFGSARYEPSPVVEWVDWSNPSITQQIGVAGGTMTSNRAVILHAGKVSNNSIASAQGPAGASPVALGLGDGIAPYAGSAANRPVALGSAGNPAVDGVASVSGKPGGVAIAGAIRTVDGARAGALSPTLPASGLYRIAPQPEQRYLVETDPRFTSYRNFLSSDYLLERLGIDPQQARKRLGDGFYEQRQVLNQATGMSGQRYLAGYASAEEEYMALMSNGVAFAQEFKLVPGIALSDEQMAALTSDIVWLVDETVTLPDGSQQTVLAPQVYLARNASLTPTGALIAGDALDITAGDVDNRGSAMTARKQLHIDAGHDIDNTGGSIMGGDVRIHADNNLLGASVATSERTRSGKNESSLTSISAVSRITADGDLMLSAGQDLTLYGAQVNAGNDARLEAGGKLGIGGIATGAEYLQAGAGNAALPAAPGFDVIPGDAADSAYHAQSSHTVGTTMSAGGNLTVLGQGDIAIEGSQMSSGKDLLVAGMGRVAITDSTDSSSLHLAVRGKGFSASTDLDTQTAVGSSLRAGGNATVLAGVQQDAAGKLVISADSGAPAHDLLVRGSSIAAGVNPDGQGNAVLRATGNVSLTEAGTHFDSRLESRASSSNPVSDKSSHDISSLSADTTHGSMVSGNQVSIAAGGDLAIRGSAVAGSGDVALKAGGRVDITAARSNEREYRLTDSSQSGLSVGPASISMGSQQQRGEYSAERSMESQSRSIVGSSGGNLVIRAGRDVQVSGSDLVAGKAADDSSGASGNIAILAQNIGIDPGQDSERSTEMRQASQRGVSAALTGTPLDMVRNMNAIGDSGGSKAQKTKAGMEEISNSGATAPQVAISYSSAGSNSQVTRTYSVNMGSSVQAGGDILLKASGDGSQDAAGPSASGDIHITGSTVAAGGAVMLDAARDITVQASADRLTQISTAGERNRRFSLAAVSPGDAARSTSGSPNSGGVNQAPYNAASLNDNASAETSAQHASLITGDRVTLLSHGGDIIVSGSGIGAVHDINLKAQQGQILVEAGRNSEIRHEDRGVHAIGDLGSSRNGTASTVGVSTSHDSIDSATQAQGPVRSQIVSTSGNVTLDAHGDITVRGSDLAAGRALALTGENIYLEPATDSGQGRESHEASQYGITVAAGGLAGTLMQGVNQALDAHARSKDPRLAALYGAKTGLAMYNYAKAAEAVEAAQRAAQAAQAAGEAAQDVKPAAKPVLVKVTVSVGGGSSQSQAGSQVSANTGSRLTGIDRVSLTATGSGRKDESGLPADGDINAIGAHIGGGDITMVAARDIALLPAQDSVTRRGSNDSSSASIGVGFALGGEQNGFTVELAAASASGKANTDSATYQQTEVTAAGKLDMRSGRDTTLHGAEVRGDSVDMEVGRNLDIVSSQDKEVVLNRQHSAGVDLSICVPPICYGVPVTGSGNVAAADTDSDYLSVKEQSGVYAGKGGYRIDVEGNTHLGGAVIASAAEAEQNRLVTGTLSLGDLTNRAEYRSDNIAVSAGTSGSGSATVLPAVAGSNGAAGGVTYSAISPGSIVITDEAGQQALSGKSGAETVAGIRRDTGDANGAIARIFDQQKVQQQMEMARLVGEVGYQAVGIIGQKLHLAEGSLEKIALHAAVGYLQGQIAGGNGLITGLVAGGNEVLGTMVEDYLRQHTELTPGQRDAIEQWSALMTGGLLASAMSGNSANATGGAATALDGERYNRQLHPEIKPFISALAKEQDRFSEEELQAAARVVTANDRVADGTRRGYESEAAAAADGVEKVTRAPDGKYYETVSASPGAIAYVTTEMRTGPAAIQNEFNAAQLDRLKYDPKPWFDETQNSGVDILTNATLLGGNGAAPTVQGGGAVRRRAGSGVTNGAGEETAGANSAGLTATPVNGATRTVSLGFQSEVQQAQAIQELQGALNASGITDATIGVRGSSVTGSSYRTGAPFRPASDIDAFIESAQLTEGLSTSKNIPGFVHPNSIMKNYPLLDQWATDWTKILGRDITPGAFTPGNIPNHPAILFK